MKLEYLYPELGNLFGDSANFRYLHLSIPDAACVETHPGDTPAFITDKEVRFVYCGPMTERSQRIALELLRPHKAAMEDAIQRGTHMLFTGNSMELPGSTIETAEETLEGLGLVELHAKQDLKRRYNGLFLGEADGIAITAFNSRFSHSTPGPELRSFATVKRGIGLDEGCAFEGYRLNNLVGTYLLGPLLVLNPLWTQHLLTRLGVEPRPAFFAQALRAYEARKAEFDDLRRKLD